MLKNSQYTYRLSKFLIAIIAWEIVFWILTWQVFRIFGVFTSQATGEQVTFLTPTYGWWLILIPLIGFLFTYQLVKRNQLVRQLGNEKTVQTFTRPVSTLNVFIRYFLMRNAFVFIILALMQPAFGKKTVKGTTNGVEMIFALDLSNSMNTRDIEGGDSRLDVAKRAMSQFVNRAPASKVGILIFAGSVYPQLPLTADKNAAKMYIDELRTSFISNQGTNIAAALTEASEFFSKDKTKKVLVLITDGENHEGGLKSAYQAIEEKNIQVLLLGIGSEKGGIVPKTDRSSDGYLKDELGRTVISKLNPKMLDEIGGQLDATVEFSDQNFPNISHLLTQINSSSKGNKVDLKFEVKENRYQWPLTVGLLSLLLLVLEELFQSKNRKSKK